MNAILDSARGLLIAMRRGGIEARSLPLAAEAVAALGGGHSDAAREPVCDDGTSLVLAAAAGERERVVELAARLPLLVRRSVLMLTEPLLARVDPAWGWEVIGGALPLAMIEAHGSLGLILEAHQDRPESAEAEAETRTSLGGTGFKRCPEYERQRAADRAARHAAQGLLQGLDDPALERFRKDPDAGSMFFTEASAYLAAVAAVDPDEGLSAARRMLQVHSPADLQDAIRVAARYAVRAGLGGRVVEAIGASEFVSEAACWLDAAAAAGALKGRDVVERALPLVERALDELDPGREWIAGIPVVRALALGGALGEQADVVRRLSMPAPLWVTEVFWAGALVGRDPEGLFPVVDAALAIPESEWCGGQAGDFGWWLGAGDDGSRAACCRSVLRLGAVGAVRPLPGSFEEIVGATWSVG